MGLETETLDQQASPLPTVLPGFPLQIKRVTGDHFPYFSIKTYVVTPHWNGFTEMVIMTGHNICLH